MTTATDLTQSKQSLEPKLLMTTIALVLGLHIGVGIGLINMPTLTIKPPKVTPPLEISFVTPPKPTEPQPTKLEPSPSANVGDAIIPKITPEPVPKTEVQPEPKTDSKPEPSLEPNVTKTQPVTQPVDKVETVIQPTPKPIKTVENPNTAPQASPNPVKDEPKPTVPSEPQLDQQAILAQQAQEAEQISQQKAQAERSEQLRQAQIREQAENERRAEIARQQAENDRLARENTERQKAEQQRLAQEQAERQRVSQEQAQKDKAEREKAEKAKKDAQNSEPVSFGNGDASWRSKPNLNFSGNLARIIEEEQLTSIGVRLNVSSRGSVTDVAITRSSGNSQVDNAVRQRLQSAKLKPFTRNSVAVAGVGNLTINLN